jgi:hypothetical protein
MRLRADMRRVKARALEALQPAGVTIHCQGIVTLPDTAHELGIATKHACTYRGSRGHSKPVCQR